MQHWVVAYDIPDDRRRLRLANVLEDFGDRAQDSVFEVRAEGPNLDLLKQRVLAVIEPAEDKVRLYPLCRDCAAKVLDLGDCLEPAFDVPEVVIV
jgi:CRISPR-associated protein Cas2